MFIPNDNTIVQEYIEMYNSIAVKLNNKEWQYYGADLVHIYLFQDNEDNSYYFVYILEAL
jgi:hypothetical protein